MKNVNTQFFYFLDYFFPHLMDIQKIEHFILLKEDPDKEKLRAAIDACFSKFKGENRVQEEDLKDLIALILTIPVENMDPDTIKNLIKWAVDREYGEVLDIARTALTYVHHPDQAYWAEVNKEIHRHKNAALSKKLSLQATDILTAVENEQIENLSFLLEKDPKKLTLAFYSAIYYAKLSSLDFILKKYPHIVKSDAQDASVLKAFLGEKFLDNDYISDRLLYFFDSRHQDEIFYLLRNARMAEDRDIYNPRNITHILRHHFSQYERLELPIFYLFSYKYDVAILNRLLDAGILLSDSAAAMAISFDREDVLNFLSARRVLNLNQIINGGSLLHHAIESAKTIKETKKEKNSTHAEHEEYTPLKFKEYIRREEKIPYVSQYGRRGMGSHSWVRDDKMIRLLLKEMCNQPVPLLNLNQRCRDKNTNAVYTPLEMAAVYRHHTAELLLLAANANLPNRNIQRPLRLRALVRVVFGKGDEGSLLIFLIIAPFLLITSLIYALNKLIAKPLLLFGKAGTLIKIAKKLDAAPLHEARELLFEKLAVEKKLSTQETVSFAVRLVRRLGYDADRYYFRQLLEAKTEPEWQALLQEIRTLLRMKDFTRTSAESKGEFPSLHQAYRDQFREAASLWLQSTPTTSFAARSSGPIVTDPSFMNTEAKPVERPTAEV